MKPISLQRWITKTLRISNLEAFRLITTNQVLVNNEPYSSISLIGEHDLITYNGKEIQIPAMYIYLAFYKPRGIESTLHPDLKNNLTQAIGIAERVFPLGRLDKESEGLLLMTNDGSLYNKVVHSTNHQEKEYIVQVNKTIADSDLQSLASGVRIIGQMTKPCSVTRTSEDTFHITLTQGLNRQIRRMCYQLGYEVLFLKRIRIIQILLENLLPGEWRSLTKTEIKYLKSL